MPQIDPVILQLRADLRDYQSRMSQAERFADQRLSAIERRGDTMASRLGSSFSSASKAALTFGASLVTIAAAREFLRIADSAKTMEAQLRLATAGFGTLAQAQDDVRKVAADARSGLAETTELYGSFARTSKELGRTQAEAAQATETFSKALKIGGADTAQVQSATLQMGQALASTNVQWEELGQILEASPRLAKVFTDSLGVTRQELKQMASDGKLSGEMLFKALNDRQITRGIDAEFAQLPVTFEQAMTQVENAATITFGGFDKGGQFSTALANFAMQGADNFKELEDRAIESGIEIRAAYEGLRDAFNPMLQGALAAFGIIDQRALTLRDSIASLLGSIDQVRNFGPSIGNKAKAFDNKYLGTNWQMQPMSDMRGTFLRGFDEAQLRGRRAAGQTPVSRRLSMLSEANRGAGQDNTSLARPTASGGGSGGGGRSSQAAAQRSAEAAARRAEQDRLRAIREEAANARDDMRLDHEILAAKEALATAAEDVLRYQLGQIEIARKQRAADIEADVKLGNLTREEADKRILINNELSQYQNDLARRREEEAIYARDAAGLRDRQATLQAEAQLARSREERRDLEERILALAYQEEEAAIRRAYANGDIADLDVALANLRRRQLVDQELVNRNNLSPGGRYLDDLQTEAENLGDAYENIAVRGLENMNRQLSEAVKNGLGLHGVLGDIIGDFIELAIRQQILGPIANAVFGGASLFGGGGGGAFASASGFNSTSLGMSSLAGGRAGGGYVEGGKLYRVNEGAKVEAFRPQGSGEIIPLGEMAAMRGGSNVTVVQQFHLDVRGAVMTQDLVAQMNAIGQKAAQVGVSGGAAEGERRIMSRSRRTIPR